MLSLPRTAASSTAMTPRRASALSDEQIREKGAELNDRLDKLLSRKSTLPKGYTPRDRRSSAEVEARTRELKREISCALERLRREKEEAERRRQEALAAHKLNAKERAEALKRRAEEAKRAAEEAKKRAEAEEAKKAEAEEAKKKAEAEEAKKAVEAEAKKAEEAEAKKKAEAEEEKTAPAAALKEAEAEKKAKAAEAAAMKTRSLPTANDSDENDEDDDDEIPNLEMDMKSLRAGGRGKQSRRYEKALRRMGLCPEPSITGLVLRKNGMNYISVEHAVTYRFPGTKVFAVFGEPRLAMGLDAARRVEKAAAAVTNAPARRVEEVVAKNGEEEADEDAGGLQDHEIELVTAQAKASRNDAIRALKRNDGDVVNAIMDLTM